MYPIQCLCIRSKIVKSDWYVVCYDKVLFIHSLSHPSFKQNDSDLPPCRTRWSSCPPRLGNEWWCAWSSETGNAPRRSPRQREVGFWTLEGCVGTAWREHVLCPPEKITNENSNGDSLSMFVWLTAQQTTKHSTFANTFDFGNRLEQIHENKRNYWHRPDFSQ